MRLLVAFILMLRISAFYQPLSQRYLKVARYSKKSNWRRQDVNEFSSAKQYLTSMEYPNFNFQIFDNDPSSKARTGLISTPHGTVETPNFILCATKAAMKSMTMEQVRNEGTQFILSNTFHLMLTPGEDIIEKLGGLQKMTGWNGPMLTDSGGYQIFSMGHGSVAEEIKGKRNNEAIGLNKTLLSITEKGATFRSYVDGAIHSLTPERSIDIQHKLGADLIVVLDECTPFNVDKAYTESSMRRSHRWGDRCLKRFSEINKGKQALYGIVQGGIYEDLRQESCEYVNNRPFFGIAIGGSLGARKKEMHDIVTYTRGLLRNDRPVHLLGIGGIRDIFHGVRQGIDTFDCVHPTRLGRHGGALVKTKYWSEETSEISISENSYLNGLATKLKDEKEKYRPELEALDRQLQSLGKADNPIELAEKLEAKKKKILSKIITLEHKLNLRTKEVKDSMSKKIVREHIHLEKAKFRVDPRPIDKDCTCYTCKNFSRGYIHHLFRAKEMLGPTLVSTHNVHFMNEMMRNIREGIKTGKLDEVEKEYIHPNLISSLDGTTSLGE
eukprot:gene11070-12065_t